MASTVKNAADAAAKETAEKAAHSSFSWRGIAEDGANMGKNAAGGFKKTGEVFVDAAKGGAGIGGFFGRAANGMAKAAAKVAMAPFRLGARIFNTRFGGAVGAATVVTGAAVATGVGLHKWNKHKQENAMREAIAENQAQIAATQADLGSTNTPSGNAAAQIEAERLRALQQQRGAAV